MNERIRELAEQAEDWADSQNFYASDYRDYLMERFAELIVQECVRYFNEDYERDFDSPWREDLSRGIKQHFGVES